MDIFRSDALAGKSILVTGGGSGLGKEISRALLAKGAMVHICGRRQIVLDTTVAELAAATPSGKVFRHVCDVREPDQIDAMMNDIWTTAPLTGLVNNAAANFIAPTKELSPKGFRAVTFDSARRRLFCDVGRRQTLDCRRAPGVGGEQPGDMGLDRFGFRRSFRHGKNGAARNDDVPGRGMGAVRHPTQCDGSRSFSDAERVGETEPHRRLEVQRHERRHGSPAPLWSDVGASKFDRVSFIGRL